MYTKYISQTEKKNVRIVSLVSAAFFWVFCLSYLAVSYKYLLSTAEDLSLFIFNVQFFLHKINQPGGVLLYIGSFFTQFLYYPLLGATIITALLQCVQWVTYKAFNFNKKYMILSYIPSYLLLIILTNAGRSLYLMTHVEYMFTYILGTLGFLLAYYLYISIETMRNRLIALLFLFPILFFGMSGSIAIFFLVLVLFNTGFAIHYRNKLGTCLIALFLYLSSFIVAVYLIYPHSEFKQVFLGVRPAILLEAKWISYLPHIFTLFFFLFIGIKQRFSPLQNHIKSYTKWTYTNLIVLTIFCASTASLAYGYADYRYEMILDQSIIKRDFERAYRVGKGTIHPTREMTVMRNFALILSGKSGEKMFEYTQNWGTDGLFFDYLDEKPAHPAGAYIFSYLGATNLASKLVNNNFMYKEYSFRMLNNFVLMAAVNGNWLIAEKVSKALTQTLYHKDIAIQYHNLYKDTTLVSKDTLLLDMRNRKSKHYYQFPQKGQYTAFIDKFYKENPSNRVAFDYYMMSALLEKRIYKFVLGLKDYDKFYKGIPLPKHYAEAVALYKYIHNKHSVKVVPQTQELFDGFIKLKAEQKNPVSEKNIMRRSYGETYWWYYMYK